MGVLETAMKIANQDADAEDEEEDGHEEAAKVKRRMGEKKQIQGLPNGQIVFFAAKKSDCFCTKPKKKMLYCLP